MNKNTNCHVYIYIFRLALQKSKLLHLKKLLNTFDEFIIKCFQLIA